MQGTITVRYAGKGPRSVASSSGTRYGVERAWRIQRDGLPIDAYVVELRAPAMGLTVVDYGGERRFTSQHIGISAGDLARLVAPRLPETLA